MAYSASLSYACHCRAKDLTAVYCVQRRYNNKQAALLVCSGVDKLTKIFGHAQL